MVTRGRSHIFGILVCTECGSPMPGFGGMGKVKLDGKHADANIIIPVQNIAKDTVSNLRNINQISLAF